MHISHVKKRSVDKLIATGGVIAWMKNQVFKAGRFIDEKSPLTLGPRIR